MTQTAILLYTLAAMAALAIGYLLGWVVDCLQPYVAIAYWLITFLWLDRKITSELDELFVWFWDAGLRAEPYLDTEPA